MDEDITTRDKRCVACGELAGPMVDHHRRLGDRADDRLSGKIRLCGFGNMPPGCHGLVHQHGRLAREVYGYIVSKHFRPEVMAEIPVWYNQPARGPLRARFGWFLLTDTGLLVPRPGLSRPDRSLTEELDHART